MKRGSSSFTYDLQLGQNLFLLFFKTPKNFSFYTQTVSLFDYYNKASICSVDKLIAGLKNVDKEQSDLLSKHIIKLTRKDKIRKLLKKR